MIVGEEFIRVFEEEAAKLGDVRFLVQGTLYSDVIESGGGGRRRGEDQVAPQRRRTPRGHAHGARRAAAPAVQGRGAPRRRGARAARAPGLAPAVSRARARHPHHRRRDRGAARDPARADAVLLEEVRRADLYRDLWQCFAVLPAIRSVGVQGDERTYAYPVVIRAVTSEDAMTADWARLPYDLLETISSRIINEVPGVNRVVSTSPRSRPPQSNGNGGHPPVGREFPRADPVLARVESANVLDSPRRVPLVAASLLSSPFRRRRASCSATGTLPTRRAGERAGRGARELHPQHGRSAPRAGLGSRNAVAPEPEPATGAVQVRLPGAGGSTAVRCGAPSRTDACSTTARSCRTSWRRARRRTGRTGRCRAGSATCPMRGVAPFRPGHANELHVSHWNGPLPELEVSPNWTYDGRWQGIFGRLTYQGVPVHGFRTPSASRPEPYARYVYIDTHNSPFGPGWQRAAAILTHLANGAFCHSFVPQEPPPGFRYPVVPPTRQK